MRILLIDCKDQRRKAIADGISQEGIKVKQSPHVDGENNVADFTDETIPVLEAFLKKESPDLILLHVGDQAHAVNCLKWIYKQNIVVCFTGAPIPQEVANDCAINGNPKHCYYPGTFETTYPTMEAWRQSIEGSAVLKFIDGVEEYLKHPKDSEEANRILQNAKETLQQFDSGLETALNELTEDLRKLLQPGQQPTEHQLKDLTDKRNRLIGSNP